MKPARTFLALLASAAAGSLLAALTAGAQEVSPSPSPMGATPSPSPAPSACPTTTRTDYTVVANQQFRMDVFSSEPDVQTTFTLTRTAPDPVAVVRRASGIQVPQFLTVPENTSLVLADDTGNEACQDIPIRVNVVPTLTLGAMRNATRDYTFTGRVVPGRGQLVTLYRTNSDGTGNAVIAAQARVGASGTWRIDRRFTGSGRFGFHASVQSSRSHLAGRSSNRPTVVH